MKKVLLLGFLLFAGLLQCYAQSQSLFDDRVLATVRVWISADSLTWLFNHPTSDKYLKANMVYADGVFSDSVSGIGFRLRGNTSRFSKKKSFKISFNEFFPGRRYQGVKKINLNGQHNDPTMVREKFFYEMWKKAGLPERRTSFMRLEINGRYMGLYTGLEEMDKDWLQRVFGNNQGNLFKCTYPADLVYLGPQQEAYKAIPSGASTGGRAYSLETNETLDDYSGLVQLCARLQDPVTASFPQNMEGILNVDLFLKALALDVGCGNWDDYAFNKNNYFLYRSPLNGQFQFITYDADNTFGVDWFGINWSTRNLSTWWNPQQARPLVSKLMAYFPYKQRYYQICDSLNRFVLNPDSCFPWLDRFKLQITPAAEADSFRTLDYGYDISDFHQGFSGPVDSHTPIGIKPFLQARYQATQAQVSVLEVSGISASGPFSPYPNPGRNRIKIPDKENQIEKFSLLDLSGRDVTLQLRLEKDIVGLELGFDNMPKGIYLLHIQLRSGERRRFRIVSE